MPAQSTSSTAAMPSPHHDEERSLRTRELFERAETAQGQELRDIHEEIVLANISVADALARRYAARGLPLDDLTQVARLALVRVVPQFRQEFGRDFLAYAVPSVLGALRKQFRDTSWVVRPPRRVQEAQQQVSKLRPDLVQLLGREPTVAEVCEASGLDEETVIEVLNVDSCFSPASLDKKVGSEDEQGTDFGALLGFVDDGFAQSEARTMLAPLLKGLDERDRLVLKLRFIDGLTQREVGEQIGVTQMQVSRILTRVLGTLREQLGDPAAA